MENKNTIFTWKIGGEAGQGQQSAGAIFSKVVARRGYSTFGYSEFPSIIRGGHVTFAVSVAPRPITAIYRTVNLLIALNSDTVKMHIDELSADGGLIFDSSKILEEDMLEMTRGKNKKIYPLPLETILEQNSIKKIASNMVALGASLGLLEFDIDAINDVVNMIFKKKSPEVQEMNRKAVGAGYKYAQEYFDPKKFPYDLNSHKTGDPQIIISCNQALALGAIASGCQLYVAYPMSPSSSILHAMAGWAKKTGMLVYQPEDEIAGVHVMLGAMHAGTRAMTGTSGGGFALMNEAVTLASITETPAVIAVCSRPGPATGLPTWTEQGDLKFLVNCGHGDFPRVVLAPSNPQEAYDFASLAFNIAEKYQLPVLILLDKYISEGGFAIDSLNTDVKIERGKILTEKDLAEMKEEYHRFKIVKDGVSPRSLAGTPKGIHLSNSDEHDEYGYAIEGWAADMRIAQVDKRARKIEGAMKELPKPQIFGPKKAKATLLGWGSTKCPVLEALPHLQDVNYIHIPAVWPIDGPAMEKALKGVKTLIHIENNYSGQFMKLLRAETGIKPDHVLLKYDGRQFWPEEIVEKVRELI